MDDVELERLLPSVVAIARRAGERILDVYRSDFAVQAKDDESPLTEADLASHRTIVDGLTALTPALPILSEESVNQIGEERRAWRAYWLVDPLDGTREFIKRNGEFTVNIALVCDHVPVLGVVHAPALGLTYYSRRGAGAFRTDHGGEVVRIEVAQHGRSPIRVVGSRSHRGSSLDKFLERIGAHELVPMGSSLKFCVVAEGGADVYPRLGPTSEWDTAAAHAVILGAGGHVVELDGRPLRYNMRADFLNPHFLVYGDASRDWSRGL
jgi:3'(2'), 5'-bisphosphate nucleotidase